MKLNSISHFSDVREITIHFVPNGTICKAGPRAMQLYGFISLDARQMIYACFVELVLKSVPRKVRRKAQNGILFHYIQELGNVL